MQDSAEAATLRGLLKDEDSCALFHASSRRGPDSVCCWLMEAAAGSGKTGWQ